MPQEQDVSQPSQGPILDPVEVIEVRDVMVVRGGQLHPSHTTDMHILSNGQERLVCKRCGWIGQTQRSVAMHYNHHTQADRKATREAAAPPVTQVATEHHPRSDSDEGVLNQIRALLKVTPEAEVAELRARIVGLESELRAMREEREALKQLLA